MYGLIIDEMRWYSVSQHVRLLVGGPTFGSAALNQLAAELPATSVRRREHRNIEHEMEASCPLSNMNVQVLKTSKTCMPCFSTTTHRDSLSKTMPGGKYDF
jgi:hypothetical protein